MPISNLQVGPGGASATQGAFNVSAPGMFDFSSLLERQMALRDQMAQLQMQRIKDEMQQARARAQQERDMFQLQKAGMNMQLQQQGKQALYGKTGLSAMGPEQRAASDRSRRSANMAQALMGGRGGAWWDPNAYENLTGMIEAISPELAHQGLMQSGAILGSQGGVPSTPGELAAQGLDVLPEGGYSVGLVGGTPAEKYESGMISGALRSTGLPPGWQSGGFTRPRGLGKAQAGYFEKGGRVPATGTYKLHRGEVVVPKDAADVVFPYALRGPAKGKGKPRKSYQQGTMPPEAGLAMLSQALPRGAWEQMLQQLYRYKAGLSPSNLLGGLMAHPVLQTGQPTEGGDTSWEGVGRKAREAAGWLYGHSMYPALGGMYRGAFPKKPGAEAAAPVEEKPPPETKGETRQQAEEPELLSPEAERMDTAADIAERDADLIETRADALQRYAEQFAEPNPQLRAMIADRDRSAQRYRRRASDLRTRAEAAKTKAMALKGAEIEAGGRVGAAQAREMGEVYKEQLRAQGALRQTLVGLVEQVGRKNLKDDQFISSVAIAFGPHFRSIAEAQGRTEQEVREDVYLLATAALRDPDAAGRLAAMAQW